MLEPSNLNSSLQQCNKQCQIESKILFNTYFISPCEIIWSESALGKICQHLIILLGNRTLLVWELYNCLLKRQGFEVIRLIDPNGFKRIYYPAARVVFRSGIRTIGWQLRRLVRLGHRARTNGCTCRRRRRRRRRCQTSCTKSRIVFVRSHLKPLFTKKDDQDEFERRTLCFCEAVNESFYNYESYFLKQFDYISCCSWLIFYEK